MNRFLFRPLLIAALAIIPFHLNTDLASAAPVTLTGEIVDSASRHPIPARLYVHNEAGQWFFPVSAATNGSAIRYERQNGAN